MKKYLLALLMVVLLLTSCTVQGETQKQDGGKPDNIQADELVFIDGYSKVASKCDGPNMVYLIEDAVKEVTSAISVVANDPRCVERVNNAER
jgi:hypothetical protein